MAGWDDRAIEDLQAEQEMVRRNIEELERRMASIMRYADPQPQPLQARVTLNDIIRASHHWWRRLEMDYATYPSYIPWEEPIDPRLRVMEGL